MPVAGCIQSMFDIVYSTEADVFSLIDRHVFGHIIPIHATEESMYRR